MYFVLSLVLVRWNPIIHATQIYFNYSNNTTLIIYTTFK